MKNTVKINEDTLRKIIAESVKTVLKEMDELSPHLLQRASDKAWDTQRYSQAEKFEDEAGRRAEDEFGGKTEYIKRITPKSISVVTPEGDGFAIYRDGFYYFRPKSGYNNESGSLTGMSGFPDYMKIPDRRMARSIVRWWKTYYEGEKVVPFMDDWHNLVEW